MRFYARLLLLFSLIVLTLAHVEVAWAHAQLLSTEPEESAVLEKAPGAIELTFNEPVSPLAITLIQPDGTSLDLTGTTEGGVSARIPLPSDIGEGTQVLSWRVVSTDGHPIGGSLVFSIGTVTGAAPIEPSGDRAVSIALWTSKTLLFLAMFFGIGGAAFLLMAPLPQQARGFSRILSIGGIFIAPLSLGLQGLDALSLSLPELLDFNAWRVGLSTSYGATALSVTLAFVVSAAALTLTRSRPAMVLAIGAVGLAALSLALSGHASAAAPQWVTHPAVFLHIGSLLFWIGALLPLWLLMQNKSADASMALANFSKYIPFAVVLLIISGIILAVIQMGPPSPSWITPYGFILAAKLGLLALLFALALWNRHWLTAPAMRGDATAISRLRRSIGWEIAIVIAILALVAGWRFTPPPRALADRPSVMLAEPITTHFFDGDTMAMITMTPGGPGPVDLDIMIADLGHAPKDALAVSVILTNVQLGIEPITREAIDKGGMWRVEGLTIPASGTWDFEIEVRLSRFERARPSGEIVMP